MDPKIGINRLTPSLDLYFNTTKMNTKNVWLWGFTPPPTLDKVYTFIFLFVKEDLPKIIDCSSLQTRLLESEVSSPHSKELFASLQKYFIFLLYT